MLILRWQKKEIDIAALALIIGGPKLVYALSKALALPSLSTVYKASNRPRIVPCISSPEISEIIANIETHFATQPVKHLSGLSILIDELNLDERPRYHQATDCVIGICREHSAGYDMKVVSMETVEALATGLKEQHLHRAKEATVVGIARYDREDYAPYVIMLSGTCKTEEERQQALWIEKVVEAWREAEHGARVHGALWTVASDGDATRRRAFHRLFMQRPLDSQSPLYKQVGTLRLMNIFVGRDDINNDFDFKHVLKRWATLMRVKDGVLVAKAHVQPAAMRSYMLKVPGTDRVAIAALYDPKDHQNVPKAVKLLSAIVGLKETAEFASNPVHRPDVLLANIIESLLQPYINPSLGLSDQLSRLSTAAHLLLVLYRESATALMPGQLYYDTQAVIKSAYFCVAKQQALDPEMEFFILQCGTDRLEGLFGEIRSIDSSRNVDLLQLTDRASAASHMTQIFHDHPKWDRGHRRLSLTGKEGIDHTNPKSWLGDTHVKNVSLLTCWNSGRRAAETILKTAHVEANFQELQSLKDIDMMRPRGHYVGLRADEVDWLETATENLKNDTADAGSQPAVPDLDAPCELDDLLPDPDDRDAGNANAIFEKPDAWLKVTGAKSVHKASVVRLLLSDENISKSSDRLRRVRGYSKDPSKPLLNDDSVLGDSFVLGRLVATFIRIENTAALAIMRVTALLTAGNESVSAISLNDLSDEKVKLKGQILSLKRQPSGQWTWTGEWEALRAPNTTTGQAASGKASKKELLFTVMAPLVRPVNANLVGVSEELAESAGINVTWSFDHDNLSALAVALWDDVKNFKEKVISRQIGANFPYRDIDGMSVTTRGHSLSHRFGLIGSRIFINGAASDALSKVNSADEFSCFQCNATIKAKKMRDHQARHILEAKAKGHDSGSSTEVWLLLH